MVKRPRPAVAALLLLLLALGGWSWLHVTGAAGAGSVAAFEPRAAESPLPRIALSRLKASAAAPEAAAGRDVFRFGKPPAPPESERPVQIVSEPTPAAELPPPTPPPPPTLPPLAVKYIGTLEQKGMRVAVLLTDDKKEVLTGREGETVANRLKIVKIGLESVDVLDVGSERTRRIPLKGN